MKPEIRTIGFDDGPHTRPDGRVPVVGVHMRGATRVEGVIATDVERDGDDATNRIATCLADSGLRGVKAILLDGASFGGFNVVDLDGLREEIGVPCISFTKGVPNMDAMRAALRHVPNPEGKWALLSARRRLTIPTETTPLTVSFSGIGEQDVIDSRAHDGARARAGAAPDRSPHRERHAIGSDVSVPSTSKSEPAKKIAPAAPASAFTLPRLMPSVEPGEYDSRSNSRTIGLGAVVYSVHVSPSVVPTQSAP